MSAISPYTAGMRAADQERDAAVRELTRHAEAGRLDVAELERRVERALAATHRHELDTLFADLPTAGPRRPSRWPAAAVLWPALLAAAVLACVLPILVLGHPIAPVWLLALLWWSRRRSLRA
jgi:hypothetical protein